MSNSIKPDDCVDVKVRTSTSKAATALLTVLGAIAGVGGTVATQPLWSARNNTPVVSVQSEAEKINILRIEMVQRQLDRLELKVVAMDSKVDLVVQSLPRIDAARK